MTEMSRWPNCLRKKMTDMSQRNKLCFEADLHFFSVNFGESTIGKVKKLQTYLRQTVQQCWQIFSDLYFCRIRSSFSCSQARNTRSGNNFFSRPRLSSHHLWKAKQRKWRSFRFVARFCELKSLSSSLGRSRLASLVNFSDLVLHSVILLWLNQYDARISCILNANAQVVF